MKSCNNEQKIIALIGEELTEREKDEIVAHFVQCSDCRRLYEEYTAIKINTAAYYSSIDFYSRPAVAKEKAAGILIFRKMAFAFSAAASFVLGFLLVQYNLDNGNNNIITNDSTYNITEEPMMILNESEWSLELNLIQQKIEILSEQMKQ